MRRTSRLVALIAVLIVAFALLWLGSNRANASTTHVALKDRRWTPGCSAGPADQWYGYEHPVGAHVVDATFTLHRCWNSHGKMVSAKLATDDSPSAFGHATGWGIHLDSPNVTARSAVEWDFTVSGSVDNCIGIRTGSACLPKADTFSYSASVLSPYGYAKWQYEQLREPKDERVMLTRPYFTGIPDPLESKTLHWKPGP